MLVWSGRDHLMRAPWKTPAADDGKLRVHLMHGIGRWSVCMFLDPTHPHTRQTHPSFYSPRWVDGRRGKQERSEEGWHGCHGVGLVGGGRVGWGGGGQEGGTCRGEKKGGKAAKLPTLSAPAPPRLLAASPEALRRPSPCRLRP